MIVRRRTWQLQEAKNKLSEVVRRAREEGPQVITLRGEEVAVVLSSEAFAALEGGAPQGEAILQMMRKWAEENEGIELELPPRTIDRHPPLLLDEPIQ